MDMDQLDMDLVPAFDLRDIIEQNANLWEERYSVWLTATRLCFNSVPHQKTFNNKGTDYTFFILPPPTIPKKFKVLTITTTVATLMVRFDSHSLCVNGFGVGDRWFIFKNSGAAGLGNYNVMEMDLNGDCPQFTKRENVALGKDAFIGAVDTLANPNGWIRNNVVYPNNAKCHSIAVLFQMLSEAIQMRSIENILVTLVHTNTLELLAIGDDENRDRISQIGIDENSWSRLGRDIQNILYLPLAEQDSAELHDYFSRIAVLKWVKKPDVKKPGGRS